MKKVGILGGGQLGLLLAQSISRLGGRVSIYDPDTNAPAALIAENSIHKPWTDTEALREFFLAHDVVTYEFENVNSESLLSLNKLRPLIPAAQVLKTTQNRFTEKSFLKENQLPHASFAALKKVENLTQEATRFGYPCIFKTAFGGYDGKGQYLLKDAADAARAQSELSVAAPTTNEIAFGIFEELIELELEVSCIVARSPAGEEVAFPIMENIHYDHILDYTICPARVSDEVASGVKEIALQAARSLNVYGLLTTEFFLTRTKPAQAPSVVRDGWHIMINEFAPRPHNSGHVTMKACNLSQFDALARILLDVPLQQPALLGQQSYCMANLLGDLWQPELNLAALANHPELADIVLYGKKDARPKRKMGHLVVSGKDGCAALEAAKKIRSEIGTAKSNQGNQCL